MFRELRKTEFAFVEGVENRAHPALGFAIDFVFPGVAIPEIAEGRGFRRRLLFFEGFVCVAFFQYVMAGLNNLFQFSGKDCPLEKLLRSTK